MISFSSAIEAAVGNVEVLAIQRQGAGLLCRSSASTAFQIVVYLGRSDRV
jgi:hypothetical protein